MGAIFQLFDAGYRVFFLAAAVFAVTVMTIWGTWLAVHYSGGMIADMPFAIAPHLWHGHEMIFGYGSAAISGFLLTASPNWTGQKAGGRAFFAVLFLLWLAGRLAFWFSGSLPWTIVAVADLAFMPVLMLRILFMLLKRPKAPQLILLAVLSIFWMGNVSMYLEWLGMANDTAATGLLAGLYALSALIVILGGRVTPAFTRNAMIRTGDDSNLPYNPQKLAALSIVLALVVPVAILVRLPWTIISVAGISTGTAVLIRISKWRSLWTLNQPILWTLHLSYLMNGVGFILIGLAFAGIGSQTGALHVTAIGGVAGMTVSVMSRAILGHSGRELVAPDPLVFCYILIPIGVILRYAASAWTGFYFPGVLGAAALWIMAFGLFVYGLFPAFFGRVGKTVSEDSP